MLGLIAVNLCAPNLLELYHLPTKVSYSNGGRVKIALWGSPIDGQIGQRIHRAVDTWDLEHIRP